jgi:hypothetical protein
MIDAIVRELDEQDIGCLQSRTCQREEQASRARHTAKQPTPAHIRIKPDGDFRHRHPRCMRHHTVARAGHQAHAAAHDNTVPPAEYRLRIGVNRIIEAILATEEAGGIRIATNVVALRRRVMPDHGLVDLVQVRARGKSFLSGAFEHDQSHTGVGCPCGQALGQQVDHFQRQGVQRPLGVEPRDADACAVCSPPLLEQYRLNPGFSHAIFDPGMKKAGLTRRI